MMSRPKRMRILAPKKGLVGLDKVRKTKTQMATIASELAKMKSKKDRKEEDEDVVGRNDNNRDAIDKIQKMEDKN